MEKIVVVDHEFIIGDNAVNPVEKETSHIELTLKKNRRFFSIGTLNGILSAKKMFSRLTLTDEQITRSTGIYCTQFGYLHPDFNDLLAKIDTRALDDQGTLFNTMWYSNKINPFLLTRSLSNNLLGLVSQEFGIKSDCAAFLRDNTGLLAALREAQLSLYCNKVDYALVMASGVADKTSSEQQKTEFGLSLMLKRDDGKGKCPTLPDYDELLNYYQTQGHCGNNLSFVRKLISVCRL
ncbi:hypothetical protein FEM41_10105 [Jejubacter calystegiae]|uniref:Uncharacterized protein n=1 Tax=Jejubacter calystegiae TaxID=2579935 RepID=A0A4P8YN32_9ENTR|nr:hypothetical protein [Jejubacter calystegiae]QCT19982.1 hypothetical protein FEM41_10105 [Jejubacter calystegiae]